MTASTRLPPTPLVVASLLLIATVILLSLPTADARHGPTFAVSQFQPDLQWGGRTVAASIQPGSADDVALVATETGGLFRTRDGGGSWRHVDSLEAFRTTDVAYSPDDPDVVVATARADSRNVLKGGRVVSGGGIWVSRDAGRTWDKPGDAEPPGSCPGADDGRANAWGIAFEAGTDNVYVGTDCGLAISDDLGRTWIHMQVNGSQMRVTAVVAADGLVDICNGAGHFRLDASAGTWQSDSLPGGCPRGATDALAVSPLERDVLFAAVDGTADRCESDGDPDGNTRLLYESDDGGQSWFRIETEGCGRNRDPHVSTPPVPAGAGFSLFFGNGVNTWRLTGCTGPGPQGGPRCTVDDPDWDQVEVDHPDQNGLVYAPGESCPTFMTDDGGIERTDDCGRSWSIVGNSTTGLTALQLYGVSGQIYPDHVDLYIGTQDNSIWASPDGGATWGNPICCEVGFPEMQRRPASHDGQIATSITCAPCGNFKSTPHYDAGAQDWPDPTDDSNGFAPKFLAPDTYLQWGNASEAKMFITTDAGENWDLAFDLDEELDGLGFRTAGPPGDTTVYVPVTRRDSGGGFQKVGLVRVEDVTSSDPVQVFDADDGLVLAVHARQFDWRRMVSVDPNDPQHLLAADYFDGVKESTDGGDTWTTKTGLNDLIKSFDRYKMRYRGSDSCCPQVSAITFHPEDSQRILVGTDDAGIFQSVDGGTSWFKVPGSDVLPMVTGFFFEDDDVVDVATWGRGLWRFRMPDPVDPDRFESNDDPGEATPVGADEMGHRHIPGFSGVEEFRGSGREAWSWRVENLTLHSRTDEDWFRIQLPDPWQGDADLFDELGLPSDCAERPCVHPGMPDCAVVEVDVPELGGFVESAHVVARGSLHVSNDGETSPGDELMIRHGDTVAPLGRSIDCPRSPPDTVPGSPGNMSSILVSYGEDTPDVRRPHEWNLNVVYQITLDWVPELSDEGRAVVEGSSYAGGMACGGSAGPSVPPLGAGGGPHAPASAFSGASIPGRFPACDLDLPLGFGHGPSAGDDRRCWADGPGCPMRRSFIWEGTGTLDARVAGPAGMDFRLLDGDGAVLAEATPLETSTIPGVTPGLEFSVTPDGPPSRDPPAGDEPLPSREPDPDPAQEALEEQAIEGYEDRNVTTHRLRVEDLPPGLYFLESDGSNGTFALELTEPPPAPRDSDLDGVPDVFDVAPADPTVQNVVVEREVQERLALDVGTLVLVALVVGAAAAAAGFLGAKRFG